MAARPPDVLIVGLGSTHGLRAADHRLAGSMRRAGAHVELVHPPAPAPVRTMMWTDLRWARAARATALAALGRGTPAAILYSTTTAALLWPEPGAIMFDAPAAANRPGRHGLWQRPLERRRLRQAPLLMPHAEGALLEAGFPATPAITVPIATEPSGPPTPEGERDIDAITYGANPHKKGLDHVLAAWGAARREGERMLVAGLDGPPDGIVREGVEFTGSLDHDVFRALLRRARVYVTAPRREDYGLTQIEALADGCRVVTTPAPGPYAALPLLAAGLGWVAPATGLRAALRAALDDDDPAYGERALAAIERFREREVDRTVAEELLPALLRGGRRPPEALRPRGL